MSLKSKAIHGVFWVSISSALIKVINFVISIVLARLLEPSDFGLITLGLIIVNFFEIFRDFGISAALIYRKENDDRAANTAFFIFPIIAVGFYVISYLIAPYTAIFFKEDMAEIIIKVLSLTFVIWSFGNLPRTLLSKDLKFKKMVIPQILPKLSYGTVAIGMALNGYGVWSLVAGRLIMELFSVITVWHAIDWRPSYKFDKKVAVELLGYGKHIIVATLLLFMISTVDVTFIGRLLNTENLGYYSIALGIAGFFTAQISTMLSQVMFPTYSMMQGDRSALKKAYLKILTYISIICIPAASGLIFIAWDFIKVIYGDRWLPAVAALQILIIYKLNWTIIFAAEDLYLADGKPRLCTSLNLIQLILMSILLYPLTIRYGIAGASFAAMVPSFLVAFFALNEAGKIINESIINILKIFFPSIIGSFLIILSLIFLKNSMNQILSPISMLLSYIILGSLVYILFIWKTQKKLLLEVKSLIISNS